MEEPQSSEVPESNPPSESPEDLAKRFLESEEQPSPEVEEPLRRVAPVIQPKIKKIKKAKQPSRIKEKLSEGITAFSSKIKNFSVKKIKNFFTVSHLKHYVPKIIGHLFILMGLIHSIGQPITSLIAPWLNYADIAWIYLFIGVDLTGFFALPLLFIHWKLVPPFGEYGEVYQNLFVCKDVELFKFMNLNVSLPCSSQILIFYVWLFTVLFLFAVRYKPFDKIVYILADMTANYFYLVLMLVKIVALVIILMSSISFGLFGATLLAIAIVTFDFIAINIALEKKSTKPKVKYSVS